MKKKITLTLLLILVISFTSFSYYKEATLGQFLSYRIKYIHSVSDNTNITLDKQRVKEYVSAIIYWSDYYSRRLEVDIDPLLVAAILEAEANFISRADYNDGQRIGIARMKVDRAKWIAEQLKLDYNQWRMLDATDFGIRFTTYYLGLACKKYNNDFHKAVFAYEQGINNVNLTSQDKLTSEYLFKVLGRYQYYQSKLNSTPDAEEYFKHKFNQLY